MIDLNDLYQNGKRAETILSRIAANLDCTTEAFSGPPLGEHGQALEFIRLWLAIDDEQDRAKVLAFLRGVAAKSVISGEPVALAHAMQKPE